MFLYCKRMNLSLGYSFTVQAESNYLEQTDVAYIGRHGSYFSGECMGLNPHYVEILQKQWMRDDLSTITNAYPG